MSRNKISVVINRDLSPDEWRRLTCSVAIRATFGSAKAFAASLGVSRVAVVNVITGTAMSRRIRTALSDLTGYPVSVLYPESRAA